MTQLSWCTPVSCLPPLVLPLLLLAHPVLMRGRAQDVCVLRRGDGDVLPLFSVLSPWLHHTQQLQLHATCRIIPVFPSPPAWPVLPPSSQQNAPPISCTPHLVVSRVCGVALLLHLSIAWRLVALGYILLLPPEPALLPPSLHQKTLLLWMLVLVMCACGSPTAAIESKTLCSHAFFCGSADCQVTRGVRVVCVATFKPDRPSIDHNLAATLSDPLMPLLYISLPVDPPQHQHRQPAPTTGSVLPQGE